MQEWVFERNQKSQKASTNHWHFMKEPMVSRGGYLTPFFLIKFSNKKIENRRYTTEQGI
jgi:hypothetical protein